MKEDPKLQTTPYDIPSHASLTQQQLSAQTERFNSLKQRLQRVFPGLVAVRGEVLFSRSVRIFNDAAPVGGWIVALPTSAHGISTLIKFCNRYQLSPSIRSGGFATAGWAIQGELIIDTRYMDDVKLTPPNSKHMTLKAFRTPDGAPGADDAPALTNVGGPTIDATANSATVTLSTASVANIDRIAHQQIHDRSRATFQEDMSSADLDAAAQPESDSRRRLSGARVRKADEAFRDGFERNDSSPGMQTSSALLRCKTGDTGLSAPRQDEAPGATEMTEALVRKKDLRQSQQQQGDVSLGLGSRIVRSVSMQKGRSGESGADADSESFSERSGAHEASQPSPVLLEKGDCIQDRDDAADSSFQGFMAGSAPRDQSLTLNLGKQDLNRRPPTSWVDRQIDQRGTGSASPKGSGSANGSGSTHSSDQASSSTSISRSHPASSDAALNDFFNFLNTSAPLRSTSTSQHAYEASSGRSASPMMIDGNSPRSASQAASVSRSISGSSGRGLRNSQSRTSDDWDPTSSYENKRWQKHHRPEGSVGERISLPAGGFVWRSDGDVTSTNNVAPGQLPWDSAAFAASHDSVNASQDPAYNVQTSGQLTFDPTTFGGIQQQKQLPPSFVPKSLADLQDAWPSGTWALNAAARGSIDNGEAGGSIPSFAPSPQPTQQISPMQEAEGSNPYSFTGRAVIPPTTAAAILQPGVHEDKFALVAFGPGVGIRGLDVFTDKAGREGTFSTEGGDESSFDKGTGRLTAAPKTLVVNGVPYHVPVSAYPVGSTAMTTGGFGYLTRAYGLSLDNIVEVEMVLADGRIVTLNEDSKHKSEEERGLWWAVRGAAPCFGVVSRIVAKAYPVPSVYSGNLIYPLNPATAGSLIRHWRDCLKAGLPNAFYSNLILTAGPSKNSHVIVIQVCFLGPKSEGEALVQAITSWSGERTLLKDIEERSFLNQHDGVAQVLKGGSGRRWMVRGDLISTLTDEMISKSVRSFQGLGSRAVWLFELLGGAVEDVADDETCISRKARSAKFTVGSLQQWAGQAEDQKCIQSVERWLSEIVSKVSIGGPYPCFLGRTEKLERVVGSYGPRNFRRLMKLKRQVDPNGLFRNTLGHGLVLSDEEVEAALASMEKEHELAQQEAGAGGGLSELEPKPTAEAEGVQTT